MTKENKKALIVGMGALGNVAGILFAVKRKSGFWGGWGWLIVGGMAGAGVGYVTTAIIPDTEKETVDTTAENETT